MRRIGCALLLMGAAAVAQDGGEAAKVHVRIHKRVAPAVVGVRDGNRNGTGFFIHRSGWILTSAAAVRRRSRKVQVYLPGHRRVEGKVERRFRDLGAVLVRVEGGPARASVAWGDSESVRVGQLNYVLGDSFGSIFVDDQVAMSSGVISARYDLDRPHGRNRYVGPVIETSAAVNPNQAGAPCVDRHGRLIGVVSLNYSENRFAGVAIPAERLVGPVMEVVHAATGEPWLGFSVRFEEGVRVRRVSRDGPAIATGLEPGDLIDRVGAVRVKNRESFERAMLRLAPGDEVRITIRRGKTFTVKVEKKDFF